MKAIVIVDVQDDMRIDETTALHITLFNGLFTKDINILCPLKPISTMIPIEWIENFMKKYDYYEYDMLIDAWRKQND